MKKVLLLLFFLLITISEASFAQAQHNSSLKNTRSITSGIIIGVNTATIGTNKRNTGFMAGTYLNFPISRSRMSIQTELLYTQMGGTFHSGSVDNTQTLNMNYIQIPVLVKFDFAKRGSVIVPNIFIGPYFGLKINANKKGNFNGNYQKRQDIYGEGPFDSGGIFGFGLKVGHLNISFRYGISFYVHHDNNHLLNGRNRVVSLVAGIQL
jgi:hypothetical protein